MLLSGISMDAVNIFNESDAGLVRDKYCTQADIADADNWNAFKI